jgi:hypothetical protein
VSAVSKLSYALRALANPSHWFRIHPGSLVLDRELARLLDARIPFVEISDHRAKIGHLDLWTANYPYASFSTHDVMPSRRTVIRAHEWLMECALSEPKT